MQRSLKEIQRLLTTGESTDILSIGQWRHLLSRRLVRESFPRKLAHLKLPMALSSILLQISSLQSNTSCQLPRRVRLWSFGGGYNALCNEGVVCILQVKVLPLTLPATLLS